MASQSIVSPEDQRATFIELFFDLVFVFAVTQVVSLLHHGFNLSSIGQALLVFWMVWWAWTQFTWTLNAADTTHQWVEFATLVATAVAFFMAVALPGAFEDKGLWFAVPYILVRVIGLILYYWVARADESQRAAVGRFALVSIGGMVAVFIGGLAEGSTRFIIWALAVALDIGAATVGARSDGWNLHPEHFSERHGLFVIIALGETLIVAAAGLTSAEVINELFSVALLAVLITFGFWWLYFVRSKPVLEHALESAHGAQQSMLARDAFSLFHFPMLFGVVTFAVAVEKAVEHPADPLSLEGRVALALGLLLFVGGMVIPIWRATRRVLLPRTVIILATALLIVLLADLVAPLSLALGFVGVLVIAALEQRAAEPGINTSG